MKHGNVIAGQSGGPTAVINSSLAAYLKLRETEALIRCSVFGGNDLMNTR